MNFGMRSKKKKEDRSRNKMENEARQIAAMAIRFIIDLCRES